MPEAIGAVMCTMNDDFQPSRAVSVSTIRVAAPVPSAGCRRSTRTRSAGSSGTPPDESSKFGRSNHGRPPPANVLRSTPNWAPLDATARNTSSRNPNGWEEVATTSTVVVATSARSTRISPEALRISTVIGSGVRKVCMVMVLRWIGWRGFGVEVVGDVRDRDRSAAQVAADVATRATTGTPAAVATLVGDGGSHGVRHRSGDVGVERNALIGGGPFRLGLQLVEEPNRGPGQFAAGILHRPLQILGGRTAVGIVLVAVRRLRVIDRSAFGERAPIAVVPGTGVFGGCVPGDGDPDVTTVQSEFDGGVLQCAGHFGGQIGQCVHDGEAGGGLQGAGQQGGRAPSVLVAD